MREHIGLYRGKRTDNGEWVQGYLTGALGGGFWIDESTKLGVPIIRKVDPETIGECTGLTDKNGKLIFEGDVLRLYCEEHECEADGYAVIHYGRFKDTDAMSDFDHLGWYLTITSIPNEATTVFALEEQGLAFEIIGNIHDNPELLGGGDNE